MEKWRVGPLNQDSGGAFLFGIISRQWPNGLVPIYATNPSKGFPRLQRQLTQAMENVKEPLFFALPPTDERHTAGLTGRWACEATHQDGGTDFLHWEITHFRGSISGRLDQDTDYRFAWIQTGTFHAPDFHLDVSYIDATYKLQGVLREGRLIGQWHHVGKGGRGNWVATPSNPVVLPGDAWTVLPLFVSGEDPDVPQKTALGRKPGPEYVNLCRVWVDGKRRSLPPMHHRDTTGDALRSLKPQTGPQKK
jgi:hypothetical protein